MATALTRRHRARRRYLCNGNATWQCTDTIEPGDEYWRSTLPPSNDMYPGVWLSMRLCWQCALYYDVVTDEQRLDLAVQEAP